MEGPPEPRRRGHTRLSVQSMAGLADPVTKCVGRPSPNVTRAAVAESVSGNQRRGRLPDRIGRTARCASSVVEGLHQMMYVRNDL